MGVGKRAVAFVSIAIAALAFGLQSPASAAPASDSVWQISPNDGGDRGYCVEVQGGSKANSAQVQLWGGCANPELHRDWYFNVEDSSNGYYHISNVNSGKCMNVQGGSSANSAKIIQYSCQGLSSRNDQWYPVYVYTIRGFDYYHLVNAHSGKCLNVQGGKYADGTDLIQYTCSSNADNESFTWYLPGT